MSTPTGSKTHAAPRGGNRLTEPQQAARAAWVAGLGAVTAEALAHRDGISLPAARGRLQADVRRRLLAAVRPLHGQPALYTVTPAGMRAIGSNLEICRVSPSNARHLIACAAVAAGLERCYPEHEVSGERELRDREGEHGRSLASATLGRGCMGQPPLHRPDLVLWPRSTDGGALPLAIEVELTVKAPRRLQAICRAWARCETIAGVLYLTSPQVQLPLQRAIERAHAHSRVIALPLSALPGPAAQAIPSAA